MKKRILSMILCACLVLSIVPVMNLMPATKVHAETNTYTFDATTDVAAGTDNTAIDENTTYHGYFTIKGTVNRRVKSNAVYAVEVGKNATGAIQFTVTGTANVDIQFSSTGSGNISAVGLHDANGNLIENNEGITEVTGANDGKTVVTYSNLPAGTYQVVSPASSHGRGARVYYVTVTETVSSCAHTNTKSVDEVPATCGEAGTGAGIVCADCDAVISGCEEIPATGAHDWSDANGICKVCSAACAHNYTDGTCTICGMAQPTEVTATYNWTDTTNNDTTVFTNITGNSKSGLSVTYNDVTYTTGWKMESSTSITVNAPAEGTLILVFDTANKKVKIDGTPYTTDSNGLVTVENLSAGSHTITKGDSINLFYMSFTYEPVSAACTHTNTEDVAAVNPTCEAVGYTAGVKCSDCEAVISGCEEVAATGHTWDAGVVTAPTCTEAGYTTYTCTVQNCGATEKRDAVAATGHNYVDGVCSCGATESTCAHEWVTLEVIVEPTCVRVGSQRVQCSLCEATETQIIPAAHDYDPETGKCTCSGGVLDYCGATSDTVYIKDFTDETLTTSGNWLTLDGEIRTAKDSEFSATYNGKTYQAYLKLNSKMTFVLNTLADDVEQGIDGDGILILVTKSREGTNGSTKLTTLNISVNGGEAITVGVPRDGILVLGVAQNTTYTITKHDVENPLFYIQYVPGAILNNDTDEGEPGEPGESGGSEGNNNTENITTITAEITDAEGNILSQYTTLAAALAAVQNGQTVCLLEANAEEVTVGSGLAVGESFNIHFHAAFSGQITPADGVTADPTTDGYIVTRNAEPEPVDPTEGYVAYIDADKDDAWDEGETLFKTVSAALAAAGELVEGETTVYVCLLRDAEETYVIIPVGVLLDLNACTLTADYVVGFNGSYVVADRINSNDAPIGKLFVNKDIILGEEAYYDKTNTVMPVWDGTLGCYVFTKLGINTTHNQNEMTVGENEDGLPAVTFIFAHLCADVTENTYLTDGGEDNKLHIVVRLEWTVDDGTAYQDFVYSEELVSSIISGGQLFKFEMTNYEELGIDPSTLTVTAMIVSDTGVIAAGETYPKAAE